MTSLKGWLQSKVCILSNILSAFVLLPQPAAAAAASPKGSDLIYNILKWMGNYQAVLVQIQIRKTAARNRYVRIDAIGTSLNGGSWRSRRREETLTQFVLLISNVVQFFVELTGKASSGEGVRGRSCKWGQTVRRIKEQAEKSTRSRQKWPRCAFEPFDFLSFFLDWSKQQLQTAMQFEI